MLKESIKKVFVSSFTSLLLLLAFVSVASAHVSVKPSEVKVGERLNFIVGVPTEKDIPTTSIRLVIPEGVENVRPLVKTGWRAEIIKNEEEEVVEIIWSGGQVPVDMKDEFVISAKAPSSETQLNWKAYQTYSDGSVVSWDLPADVGEKDGFGPYSTTKVINDLQTPQLESHMPASTNNVALIFSIVALSLASYACFFRK